MHEFSKFSNSDDSLTRILCLVRKIISMYGECGVQIHDIVVLLGNRSLILQMIAEMTDEIYKPKIKLILRRVLALDA